MSIPKNRLYELINNISENDTQEVLSLLEKLAEKNKKEHPKAKNRFAKIFSNPLKVENINIYSRAELHER
jgi:hypothetical protein